MGNRQSFGCMAGVVTAVAIELVTKRLQEMAILSARAELQKLMLTAAAQNQTPTMAPERPVPPPAPPVYPSTNTFV